MATRTARLGCWAAALLPLGLCPAARADGQEGGGAAARAPAPADDPAQADDVVVTANRYGEASVGAETEFGETEIAGQGADSIQDLLARLAPFLGTGDEDKPILLVNGRPAEGDTSILTYPAEALNRLAVLKPEAAAHYGYPSGRRVVNLVLKKHFASLTVDADLSGPTAGGQRGGGMSAGRVAVDGPMRWNVRASIDLDGSLLKSARVITPRAGAFDSIGYVAGPGRTEIDPALSLAAGRSVTVAAIPPGVPSQAPTLPDFAAAADDVHAVDPNDFETLRPSRRTLSFAAGVTRPLGDFTASLNLTATATQGRALRGLPMASVVLPADSPWSPFARDVVLTRPFAGDRPLHNDNRAQSQGVSFALSGRIGGWQTAFSAGYSRNLSRSLLELGIDTPRAQALIDAADPAFDPYAPWSDRLLLARRNRARGETTTGRLSIGKAIADLPAGPLTMNVALNASRSRSENRSSGDPEDPVVVTRQVRSQADGLISLGLPIFRKANAAFVPLGDLAVDLYAGGQTLSGGGLQTKFGGGATWSPFPLLQLRASLEHSETAPSFDQLDGPVVATINRIFDYARLETVDVAWTTGGNPGLRRGSRRSASLTAMVRPFADQRLTLSFGYRTQNAKGGVVPFPELTPAIEVSFPERVTRDGIGRLVAIDARPLAVDSDGSAELTSGIALRLAGTGMASRRERPGADPMQVTVSFNHRWRLRDELSTRPGVPAIDRLGGDGGQSRHFLTLQAAVAKRGIGGGLSGNWSSAAHLRNRASTGGGTEFRFTSKPVFNLSFFVEPEHILSGAGRFAWMKGTRLSFDIRNVTNGYRRVSLADGSVPAGSGRDEIDPLGRTIRLMIRQRF